MRCLTSVNSPCLGLLLAGLALAAEAAPIRVGIFTGVGQYLGHTSSTSGRTVISDMLSAPSTAGLGTGWISLSEGILVSTHGGAPDSYESPTADQANAFAAALDTLDVVLFLNYEGNGALVGTLFNASQKEKIETFFRTKGVVSVHATLEGSASHWPQWEGLHGTRLGGHPATDRAGTLRLDSAAKADPSWRQLTRGLSDTMRFTEEWKFLQASGDSIRRVPGLNVVAVLDEASLTGGLGGATAMGDHPFSWYREFSSGGRLFYTAMGHRPSNYTGTGSGATADGTRFLRRQLYNAIVWAARRDSLGHPVAVGPAGPRSPRPVEAWISGSQVFVPAGQGRHTVEIRALDGTLRHRRRGMGAMAFELDRGAVYVVSVASESGTSLRRVLVP
jgi:type 1 glutamine amidotransferase